MGEEPIMTDDWNSDRAVPGRGPTGAPRRSLLSARERRQRNLIIGLSIGSVIVLLAGMIAFVATRGSGTATTVQPTALPTSVPNTVAATSSTAASTIAVETTPPRTAVPIVANADAGPDLAVNRSGEFRLIATDLAPGTPNAAVRWTQMSGPDATAGVGSLRGADAAAIAPDDVATMVFTLEVAGTNGVATDDVVVRVFEDAARAAFIDGERGTDAGNGTMEAPFKSIAAAATAATGSDLYVRSVGIYDESDATIELAAGMSLYGGFDENWNRDADRRAVITGDEVAMTVSGDAERWIASIELTSADVSSGGASIGVLISGAQTVNLIDSRVVSGRGGVGSPGGSGAVSIGVSATDVNQLAIERSTVNGGRGGNGGIAPDTDGVADAGGVGGAANGRNAGSGAGVDGAGGRGGETSNGVDGGSGQATGGSGGKNSSPNGRPGSGGNGGVGGVGGDGGDGLVSTANQETIPVGASGGTGEPGITGRAGGGGGGGFGPLLVAGGGGGGAGAGGAPGSGAIGGGGGGGSVGLHAVGVNRLVISESLIAGGGGGTGAVGGAGALGGAGGNGGSGAVGANGVLADGGNGGGGGAGGGGGRGGAGGGGAGGPSYGLVTTRVAELFIDSTRVRGGGGGAGADGGAGGEAGGAGGDGSARSGGISGLLGAPNSDSQGDGASGGSSYGWFDDSGADQAFSDASFGVGTGGAGGDGVTSGDDGAVITSNV